MLYYVQLAVVLEGESSNDSPKLSIFSSTSYISIFCFESKYEPTVDIEQTVSSDRIGTGSLISATRGLIIVQTDADIVQSPKTLADKDDGNSSEVRAYVRV